MINKLGPSLTCLIFSVFCVLLGFIPFIGPIFLFLAFAFFMAAIIGPFLNIKTIKKECPYCGTPISVINKKTGVTCKACKKRIVIQNEKFLKVS
jgi:DNA-directed RNA polymerase subunit RPC12/RpoP